MISAGIGSDKMSQVSPTGTQAANPIAPTEKRTPLGVFFLFAQLARGAESAKVVVFPFQGFHRLNNIDHFDRKEATPDRFLLLFV